jgi:hypothetical protein
MLLVSIDLKKGSDIIDSCSISIVNKGKHIYVHFSINMPLSLEQRDAMDAHIRTHTNGAEPAHGVLTFRTYVIDSIERVMDSNSTRIRDLALRNSTITCRDKVFFWRTLAELASGCTDVDLHAMEYGEPLNESDHMTRCVYTWCFNRSVLKFYTKVLHRVGSRWLVWFVCKLTTDEDHSGEDTDSDDFVLV